MHVRKALVCALAVAFVASLGCKKKADVTAGEAAAALKAAPTEHAAVETGLGPLPEGVLAVVGVESVAAIRAMAKRVGEGLGPAAGGADLLRELELPPEIAPLVDETKPLVAVIGLRGGPEGTLAVPLTKEGKAKIEAALKAAEGGAAPELAQYGLSRENAALVGDHVVRSETAALLAAHRPLLEKALGSYQPAAPVQVLVSGTTAMAAAKPAIEAVKEEFIANMRRGAAYSPLPMGGDALAEFYGAYFDAVLAVLAEVRLMDLRLSADADRLRFEALVDVVENGSLHKMVAHGEKGGIASVGLLPPGAYGVMAVNVDPALFAAFKGPSVELLSGLMTSVSSSELAAAFDDLYDVQTGDTAMALYADGGFPFSMAAVVLTTDGDRYREAMKKLSDMYLSWAESMVAGMGGGAPPVDFSSWERLVDGASAFTSSMGVKMEVKADDDVAGLSVGVDWASIGAFGDADEAKRNEKTFGSRWQMGFGFGPKVCAATFGPNGFEHAEKVLAGGFTYEDEAFQASVKRGAAHPFMVAWFDAGRASNAFAELARGVMMSFDGPQAAELAQKLAKATPGDAFAFTAGGSGTTLQAVFDIPFAPIAEMSALFGQL